MSVIVRFAPSPTGYLHIGNLRPALFNWLFVRAAAGQFVLRYDDTDAERSRREFADAILEDLHWIGIRPDVVVHQSDRLALYDSAVEQLKADGSLYPCFETPDELDRRRKRAMARGLPPIYGRDALRLTDDDRAALMAEGRRPHWRFRLPNFTADPFATKRTDIAWTDIVRGAQTIDLASLSDPVLVREDGTYLYTLPSVVDDGDMEISHVIRGDDHLTNTGVQLAIFDALGYARPSFGHLNLLTTIDGEGLSKRSGALSLRTLRTEGYEPMALASLAVLTGASGEIQALPDLDALAQRAELTATSASNAKFDPAELDRLNAEIVHGLESAAVAERLTAYGVPAADLDAFWHAVRGNCVRVPEAQDWQRIVYGSIAATPPSAEDRGFMEQARAALPTEPFDGTSWAEWTGHLKTETGRKGKALFLPLRRALTGLDHGPELALLLPLIGRERTLERLA